MDNEKKVIIDDASVIEANHQEESKNPSNCEENAEQQRLIKRKRRLIIVSLVITGILVCVLIAAIVFVSLWTTRVQVQEKKHRTIGSREVDEELYQDTVDSLTFYHVQEDRREFWVILDTNRELEIMKAKDGDSTTCYVSIIDPSRSVETNETGTALTQTTTPKGAEGQKNETLPIVSLRPSSRPILEKSILGRRGQQLCQDVDTYWILSSCNPSSAGGGAPVKSRVRRATWQYWMCCWDWNNCNYFAFSDNPSAYYYSCAMICGYQTFTY